MEHHKAAGDAIIKGQHDEAMHHVGKMLAALKVAKRDAGRAEVEDEAGESPAVVLAAPMGLRARLAALKANKK